MKRFSAILKVVCGALILVIAEVASGLVWSFSPGFATIPKDQAQFAIPAVFAAGLIFSAILRYFAINSPAKTPSLILKSLVVFFLINTIQTQVETLYFLPAFPQITKPDMAGLFVRGLVVSLVFVPLCVGLHRLGHRQAETPALQKDFALSRSWWKYALAAIAYVPIYLGFGSLAQLAPVLQQTYAGWMVDKTLIAFLPLFQLLRGSLFAAIAVLIFNLFSSRRKAITAAALSLSFFIVAELLIPSSIMAPSLRLIHFLEVTASMVLYALACGALLLEKRARVEAAR